MPEPVDGAALADRLLAAYDAAQLTSLPSEQPQGLAMADAFGVAERLRTMRIARGERPLGYKIGFTNRTIWPRYGVFEPIWAPVWSSTLQLLDSDAASVSLAGLVQPRLEPEVVFGFSSAPSAGMDEAALAGCLAWVAHGFEIVHTHFDGWRFSAPDTVADFALHGRLLVGPRVPVTAFERLGEQLAALSLTLSCDGREVERGSGRNVLDGPLTALRLWVDAMAQRTPHWAIRPGDVVTTGTLTDAWPLSPGQLWQTAVSDARLVGLRLSVTG
ncbi:MAG: hydratase [Piscinibacter sp.]